MTLKRLENVHVLSPGKFIDGNGLEVTVTKELLDKLADGYNSAKHKAPCTIGHPKENGPAYGWIDSALVDKDDKLLLNLDVTPELDNLIIGGYYRERSLSYYEGDSPKIRHLGFLGAQPPAVKGLDPIEFDDSGYGNVIQLQVAVETQIPAKFAEPIILTMLQSQGQSVDRLTSPLSFYGNSVSGSFVDTSGVSKTFVARGTDLPIEFQENTELSKLTRQLVELQEKDKLRDITGFVDELYNANRLTEGIMPKAKCVRLLQLHDGEDKLVRTLLGNLPAAWSQSATDDTPIVEVQQKAHPSGRAFDSERMELHTKAVQLCESKGWDPSNNVFYIKATKEILDQ